MSLSLPFLDMNVGAAQRAVAAMLKDADIDEPTLEARLLLGDVLGGGPERVLADRDETLTPDQAQNLFAAVQQRTLHMPMSYILGWREFWSLRFKVTAATLSPRPDSETIVEAALDHIPSSARKILDLGTGTGCLLLALLSELPEARGMAVDASEDALAVALENAASLGLEGRTTCVLADWTEADWMVALGGPFDLVVSNPPYIPSADIAALAPDVRDFEPRSALDGGVSGLDAYRRLVQAMDELLIPGGICVFEVGIGQADDVGALLNAAGLEVLEKRADLGGIERAVVGRKPS